MIPTQPAIPPETEISAPAPKASSVPLVISAMNADYLSGDTIHADARYFGDGVATDDHRIAFFQKHARGKDVLDIGCVNHDPDNSRSTRWVHRGLQSVARSLVGIDLYEKGVKTLVARGFDVRLADAQAFDLGQTFDVIVAGDVIAHLEDMKGFMISAKAHLRPEGKLLVTTPNPWNWRLLARAAFTRKTCGNPEQTMWICPQTLTQLAARHGMQVSELRYSSGPLIDRLLPAPAGWKHSTIQAVLTVA